MARKKKEKEELVEEETKKKTASKKSSPNKTKGKKSVKPDKVKKVVKSEKKAKSTQTKKTKSVKKDSKPQEKKKSVKKAKTNVDDFDEEFIDKEVKLINGLLNELVGKKDKLDYDVKKGFKKIDNKIVIPKDKASAEDCLETVNSQLDFVCRKLKDEVENRTGKVFCEGSIIEMYPNGDVQLSIQLVFRDKKLCDTFMSKDAMEKIKYPEDMPVVHDIDINLFVFKDIISLTSSFEVGADDAAIVDNKHMEWIEKGFTVKCGAKFGSSDLKGFSAAYAKIKYVCYEITALIKELNKALPETCECCGRYVFDDSHH